MLMRMLTRTHVHVHMPADCECLGSETGRGRAVRLSTCDHGPISCATECARASHYDCDGWRQTGNCSADGPREPALDLGCGAVIPVGASGYCECGGGSRRVARPPKCALDVGPTSCTDECLRDESLYETLGLYEGATERDLRQAFRRLSLRLHPDKQRSAEQRAAASTRFAEVTSPYGHVHVARSVWHVHVACGM